jgi:DNA-binding response OmpR family regulator/two-component sensor histidine kinase
LIEIKNSQLQEALNTKDKLLTVIAHDFKNPLSTLLGFAKLLREKITSRNLEDLQPNVTSIVNSADSIYSQMVEVLEWSVSKDDAVKFNPIDINIETVMKDVLSLINESASQKNILIETSYIFTRSAYVDPRMMSTILRNLIINSIKFTPHNGKILISVTEQKSCIEIILKDSGIGMSQDQIDRILSEKHLISEDYKSGFGLQICKTFINRNNGTFHISSQFEKGSSFMISIPKGKILENAIENKHEVIYNSFIEFEEEDNQRKMLVIDDNKEITDFLMEIFSDSFKVITASDGQDGLNKALQYLPEIILSDINMPIIDGKKLCQQLKANNLTNHIPIILISAQTLPHEQIDGLMHGADDYIAKPFNTNILKQKVHILLKNREILIEHLKQSINTNEKFKLPDSFDDKIIKEITSVIIENISNVDFKVDMLANLVGLSRSQLYRKTVSVLGESPNDYIKTLRLQQAIEMLKTGRYRISEIAYEVGFSDPGYFSSCFFEKYGIKPSEYSKK